MINGKHTTEELIKMSIAQKGNRGSGWRGGKIYKDCVTCYDKFSIFPSVLKIIGRGRFCSKKCARLGYNNPNWKGGAYPIMKTVRNSSEYKDWRKSVFERDNYTCQMCSKSPSGKLNADHIKPFFIIMKENQILSLSNAILCDELWSIDNGRTLCMDCHKKTETWGRKATIWKEKFYGQLT